MQVFTALHQLQFYVAVAVILTQGEITSFTHLSNKLTELSTLIIVSWNEEVIKMITSYSKKKSVINVFYHYHVFIKRRGQALMCMSLIGSVKYYDE